MDWLKIGLKLDYAFLSLVIVFEIVALTLLYRNKSSARNKNQVYLIGILLIQEFIHTTSLILYETSLANVWIYTICFYINNIFLYPTYYWIMSLITVDRFLAFYLNIRYPAHVTLKRTLKTIVFGIVILLLLCIGIVIYGINRKPFDREIFIAYLIVDAIYLILVTGTYLYIFKPK